MSWRDYPPIPRGGPVEKTYATLFARFGYWGESYLRMVSGNVPRHMFVFAEQIKKQAAWLDDPDAPPKPATVPTVKTDQWAWLDNMKKESK